MVSTEQDCTSAPQVWHSASVKQHCMLSVMANLPCL